MFIIPPEFLACNPVAAQGNMVHLKNIPPLCLEFE